MCCMEEVLKGGVVSCVLGTRVFCVCVHRPSVDDSCSVMRFSLLCHLQRVLQISI